MSATYLFYFPKNSAGLGVATVHGVGKHRHLGHTVYDWRATVKISIHDRAPQVSVYDILALTTAITGIIISQIYPRTFSK